MKRYYGEHLTPEKVAKEYIVPYVKDLLFDYIWTDMFAGEGHLIFPLLEVVPLKDRTEFFEKHVFLFDIQEKMVLKMVQRAVQMGIPEKVATKNIQLRDTIKDYPAFLLNMEKPVFHITNPPYLYIGHITKNKNLKGYKNYFTGPNRGYQDLYQLALANDIRHGIERMVYIIPSNFLFGFSVSNKIRKDLFELYTIQRAFIFEKQLFDHTGTNVVICFFEKKGLARKTTTIIFEGSRITNESVQRKVYVLTPQNNYRAGHEFDIFVKECRAVKPLEVKFYLDICEIEKNKGEYAIEVLDVNHYTKKTARVNKVFFERIKNNILFLRTLDTGKKDGKAGLYVIREVFGVDALVVSKAKYRTHPIHLFIEPPLAMQDQYLLKDYFNLMLEHFRKQTDSDFMTTFKYSKGPYTRKYLGLLQAKKLLQTFPTHWKTHEEKTKFERLVAEGKAEELITFLKTLNQTFTTSFLPNHQLY